MDRVLAFVCVLLLITSVIFYADANSVKVYRFSAPGCKFCEDSEADWDEFVASKRLSLLTKTIHIRSDTSYKAEQAMMTNFRITQYPTIVAVAPNGVRSVFPGDSTEMTSDKLNAWLNPEKV